MAPTRASKPADCGRGGPTTRRKRAFQPRRCGPFQYSRFTARRDSARGTRDEVMDWGMTATDGAAAPTAKRHKPNLVMRWWRRRRAARRRVDYTVWDLRERYGAAACGIARASARAPAGEGRRFWRKVVRKLERLE